MISNQIGHLIRPQSSLADQNYIYLKIYSMQPSNKETGGGTQQVMDAKQLLLTGCRKSQTDKQTK